MPRPSPMPRPYGPNAPWNRPVAGLPVRSDSATWAQRHWQYSPATAGQFRLIAYDFTFGVFYASDATGTYPVRNPSGGNPNGNMGGSNVIPWNPAWSTAIVAAGGSDRQAIVIDENNGYEYALWQVNAWNGTNVSCTTANLVQVGTAAGSGNPANYLTKENGFAPCRGVGIQLLMGLVRPEEFAAGIIQHALALPVTNPSTMLAVAPGTKVEHCAGSQTGPLTCSGPDIANPIPEGMRFAHTKTNAQIDAWIASGSYPISSKTQPYKNLARMIAIALRDYGWFITDTSGDASWQLESRTSAAALWSALGINVSTQFGTVSNCMLGLLQASDIITIVDSTQYGSVTPTAPAAPTNLAATVSPYNQINLTWNDNSTDELHFEVERSTNGVDFANLTTLGPNITSYQNSGLSPLTQYWYRVRATNAAGNSAYTNVATQTTGFVYTRPYGDLAPWNRAVADLPVHAQTVTLAANLYNYSSNTANNFNCNFSQFTMVIFLKSASTGDYPVVAAVGNLDGHTVPWNAAWTVPGQYADVIVLDETNHWEYNLANVTFNGSTVTCDVGNLVQSGTADTWGSPANYLTKENGFIDSRSAGIQYLAMLVRPEEISVGVIEHALCLAIANPSLEDYVAPATKLETSGTDTGIQIPLATRFSLNLTDADILAWANTKALGLRPFATIVATALRDYGFFCTQSTSTAHFQFEDNASAQLKWAALGIDGTSSAVINILDGLFTTSNIVAYVDSDSYDQPVPTVPTAPSNLAYTVAPYNQVNLTWNDNSTDETSFVVERSTNGTTYSTLVTLAANSTSYSNTGLTAETEYWYRVYASNAAGDSDPTSVVDVTTGAEPLSAPTIPSALTATAVSASQIDLAWSDDSDNETSFDITRSLNGTDYSALISLPANTEAFSDTLLDPETQYWYKVRATNAAGSSSYTAAATDTTDALPATVPDAPTLLVATSPNFSQVNLSWQDNASDEVLYYIDRSPDGLTYTRLQILPADTESYSDTAVNPSTTYFYRVSCYNPTGVSGFSNVASVTTGAVPITVPSPPTNLVATVGPYNQITLTWTDNATNEDGYNVERSDDAGATFLNIAQVSASTEQYVDSPLPQGTTYQYRVQAFNSAGWSAYTSVAEETTGTIADPCLT